MLKLLTNNPIAAISAFAALVGACGTILKAWWDRRQVLEEQEVDEEERRLRYWQNRAEDLQQRLANCRRIKKAFKRQLIACAERVDEADILRDILDIEQPDPPPEPPPDFQ